jgi:hypothetical protein
MLFHPAALFEALADIRLSGRLFQRERLPYGEAFGKDALRFLDIESAPASGGNRIDFMCEPLAKPRRRDEFSA